eukprot:SAG25_NODE_1073_length_4113_cov_8.429746_1_plen_61_part_00
MCVCPRRPQGGEKNRRGRRRGKEDRKDTDNSSGTAVHVPEFLSHEVSHEAEYQVGSEYAD